MTTFIFVRTDFTVAFSTGKNLLGNSQGPVAMKARVSFTFSAVNTADYTCIEKDSSSMMRENSRDTMSSANTRRNAFYFYSCLLYFRLGTVTSLRQRNSKILPHFAVVDSLSDAAAIYTIFF